MDKPRLELRHVSDREGNWTDEVWVEVRQDDHWVAAYRIVPTGDGSGAIGEVRIVPYDESGAPGVWNRDAMHERGIPSDVMRAAVRTRERLSDVRDILEWMLGRAGNHGQVDEAFARTVVGRFGFDLDALTDAPHAHQRMTARELAELARDYLDCCRESTRPTALLAERRCLSTSQVGKRLRQSEVRGLLVRKGRGRAGGELTPRAVELLGEREAA